MSSKVLTLRLPEESTIANVAVEHVDGLKDMQAIVGGLIEPVNLWEDDTGGVSLYMNEEGLMYDLPLNVLATDMATRTYKQPFHLVGNGFLSRFEFETGETVSLTDDDLKKAGDLLGITV